MAELSPAAQAVEDAFAEALEQCDGYQLALVAALRAGVKHVQDGLDRFEPDNPYQTGCADGALSACTAILAIANELENTDG